MRSTEKSETAQAKEYPLEHQDARKVTFDGAERKLVLEIISEEKAQSVCQSLKVINSGMRRLTREKRAIDIIQEGHSVILSGELMTAVRLLQGSHYISSDTRWALQKPIAALIAIDVEKKRSQEEQSSEENKGYSPSFYHKPPSKVGEKNKKREELKRRGAALQEKKDRLFKLKQKKSDTKAHKEKDAGSSPTSDVNLSK